jgi:hypothetical protein
MKDLEPEINRRLAQHGSRVAEIRATGAKAWANITISTIRWTAAMEFGPVSSPPSLELAVVNVSDREIYGPGPERREFFFGGWNDYALFTYSVELQVEP